METLAQGPTIPQPPWDMVGMTDTTEWIVNGCVTALFVAFCIGGLILWRKWGSPIYLLSVLGGLLATLNEPMWDVLGMVYYPLDQLAPFASMDRQISLFAVLGYGLFYGGLGYVLAIFFQRGVTLSRFWIMMGSVFVIDALLEMPIMAVNGYVYYGNQPYQIGGFPIVWWAINGLAITLCASAVALAPRFGFSKGPRALLVLLVPAVTQYAAAIIAIPHFTTLNTNLPQAWKYVGTTVSIVIGIAAIHAVAKLAARGFFLDPASTAGLQTGTAGSGSQVHSVTT